MSKSAKRKERDAQKQKERSQQSEEERRRLRQPLDVKNPMPLHVSDADVAFPANVRRLVPDYKDIPESFEKKDVWCRLFADWFYFGIKASSLTARPGIDKNLAIRHLKCILGSFELEHRHKEAAFSYLASRWFEDYKREPRQ